MTEPKSIRVFATTGALGMGFLDDSLARAIEMKPDVIACDAGSTDSGPHYLGAAAPKMSEQAIRRDMGRLLQARDALGVPLIIGSCGTSGTDAGVNWMASITRALASEQGLSFKLGLAYCEQPSAKVAQWMDKGKVQALPGAPETSSADAAGCSHIVAMMGAEAMQHLLEQGCDVILAGRTTDTALFAALPLLRGLPPGPVWHCAKTIECGAVCSTKMRADGLMADIDAHGFEVEPTALDAGCTPLGVASHTLYENADPIYITEPSGVLDTGAAQYEALNDRRTRVTGSAFEHKPYSIKLEGAAPLGYQTVAIGGIRDPYILRQLDSWTDEMMAAFEKRVAELTPYTLGVEVRIDISYYGRDAVMLSGETQANDIGHENGILIVVTAPEQSTANTVARFVSHAASHWPIPEWKGFISGIAFPFSPPEIDRGMAYRFVLHHVVTDITPLELFRFQTEDIAHG